MSIVRRPSFITLPHGNTRKPPSFERHDIQYADSLVRFFLNEFTKKGDKVLDPFTGLGTTLFVAEEMGRIPHGMEYDRRRYEWVAGQLRNWQNLVHGDSFDLPSCGFPKMDFSMTSPPYMPRHDKWNPLFAGDPRKAGYDKYLKRLQAIYRRLAAGMKKGAPVIVQADDLLHGKTYTPLVRDISVALSDVMRLDGEIIVAWDKPPASKYLAAPEITHCLLFRAR